MSCRGKKAGCQPGGCNQLVLSCVAPEQAPSLEYISFCRWDVLVPLVKQQAAGILPLHFQPSDLHLVSAVRLIPSIYLWDEFMVGLGHRATGGAPGKERKGQPGLAEQCCPLQLHLTLWTTNAQKDWRPPGCSKLLIRFLWPRDHCVLCHW